MMKKIISIAAVFGLAFAAFNASATNSHFRDQLIRSGCTQVSISQGCDINKTKAQNRAAAAKKAAPAKGTYSKFVGKWDQLDADGKQFDVVTVTSSSVKINGHLVEEPHVSGDVLYFKVQAMEANIRTSGKGHWATFSPDNKIVAEGEFQRK